jgi:outer membrane protein OmpA-like peptidoglycan-associated protein
MAVEESGSSLASSFTDLMTSLAVIFILLLVAAINNQHQELSSMRDMLAQRSKSVKDRREDLMKKLKAELVPQLPNLQIEEDPKDPFGVLVIPPKKLEGFEKDHSDLPVDAKDYLNDFAPRLASVVCSEPLRYELSSVVVEGHADSSGTDIHNLKLSVDRSMMVVSDSLRAVGSTSASMSQPMMDCFAHLLTTSGRGKGEILVTNGVEDRERSRRVVFKIRLKTLEEKELEASEHIVKATTLRQAPLASISANGTKRP